jgi:hypothetical protein
MDENWEDDDSSRLKNIPLKDINAALSFMDVLSVSLDAREVLLDEVRAECRVLHESRNSAEYRS